jgi:hypothetical protein
MTYELDILKIRLVELDWKLKSSSVSLHASKLPARLFHSPHAGIDGYIQEIRVNIDKCEEQKSFTSRHYLAKKIHQQISTLISIYKQSTASEIKVDYSIVEKMGTLKSRIADLELKILSLRSQKEAISKTIEAKKNAQPPLILALHKELSKITQQLTLAEEALQELLR